MHLQTDHFVEIFFIFRLMYRSKHELSSEKKILKNIKLISWFFVFTGSKTFVSD